MTERVALSDRFKTQLRDPARWSLTADIVAVLIALSLPWSTSLVSIFTVIWVIAVMPTLDIDEFLQSLKKPVAALPIAFFSLAVVAMLWSDAAWPARVHSAGQTAKFLLLPLLIYHYQRSSRAHWVFIAFVASCTVLMVVSFATALSPALAALKPDSQPGIPVKNYIDQSQSFSLCAVALGYPIAVLIRRGRYLPAALLAGLSIGLIADLAFVVTSRTALVSLPVLLLVLVSSLFGWRGVAAGVAAVALLGTALWLSSPQLRGKLTSMATEYELYRSTNAATSAGLRLEFWRKSLEFVKTAPVAGHGTGSIEGLFARAASGQPGSAAAEVIRNPHNQTLASAVQWGLIGVAVLWGMWIVHLTWMAGASSITAWIGFLVVLQNVVTSMFNSHLFDFNPGWMYVLGVGIAGGTLMRKSSSGSTAGREDRYAGRLARQVLIRYHPSGHFDGRFQFGNFLAASMTRFSNLTMRNFLIAIHDVLATVVAVFASFYLRFEGDALAERLPLLLNILPYFVVFSVVVCFVFKLTTTKWRFFSLPDVLNILRVASVLTVALVVLDYVFVSPNFYGAFFFGKVTIVLYWFLEIFFLMALRFAYRYYRYTRARFHARSDDASLALLIGRAADAEILLRGIESGAIKRLWPVGVLSPSPADRGQLIRNIPVLGGIDDIEDVARDFAARGRAISRIVMAPSAFEPDAKPDSVLIRSRRLGLVVSRLPSLESGDLPRLTPVAVEDLLLRPSEKIDYARLEGLVKDKAVIVTGGGGSIGSEICDRVVTFGAARLLVIEHSEPALYAVIEALTEHHPGAVIEGRIADIRDRDRIHRLMSEFKPDLVFHAAALKHVPILERDWGEGVKTNIFGTVNVADAALAAGAEAMVMISTDKAIEPVSMLGLTKRFAEMYCQAMDHDLIAATDGKPRMRLISVRFGNVLASNGSVVPKFKAQIAAGGPVTVTHPDMVRYFMTIREACDLVITAATHAMTPVRPDVSVYVLNMGQPVRIVDLAERMIRLSGLQPGHDIEIAFSGMRPGERLNEILFANEEPTIEIGVAGVMAAKPNEPPMQSLQTWIAALERAIAADDRATIRSVLKDAVPEFGPSAA